nr:M28 family peptidase [Candidatus Sigynarchaeota archaeon]
MVETKKEYRNYMMNLIERICKEFGPRRPASDAERKAIDVIKSECEQFADDVKVDEFRCAYHAYPQGLVRIAFGLITISVGVSLLDNFLYLLVIPLVALGLWVVVAELMIMLEFTDPFYKKGSSRNAFGIIKPQKDVRVRVIFGGHSDSAYEMRFARKYGIKITLLMMIAIGLGLVPVAFQVIKVFLDVSGSTILLWSAGGIVRFTVADAIFFIIFTIAYPYIVWVVKNAASRSKPVLGANDNLSGVAASLALGHHFKEHRPKHVEIWAGSFGCEEAGQRGSKRFVAKYGPAGVLDNAYTVVLESISGMAFGIVSAEKMYLTWPQLKPVYHSKELVDKFFKACENYRHEKKAVPYYMIYEATFAGTDACRFSQ